jgi:hypothetical protein
VVRHGATAALDTHCLRCQSLRPRPRRGRRVLASHRQVGADVGDLLTAEMEGLAWHESAPVFEAIAIDERGQPCRIVATDPRVWAAYKLWLSQRQDRERIKRQRDEFQARTVARLVAEFMPHLSYDSAQLKMLPQPIFDQAAPLFHH